MDSLKNWELNGYLKIENSFLRFFEEQVFFPFTKHFQEFPVTTVLIFSVFLIIGLTVFLFLYVIYLRIKFHRYQNLKDRKFVVWEENLLPLIIENADISTLLKSIKKSEYELFGEFITPYLNDMKGESLRKMVDILRAIGVAEREQYQLKHSKTTWRRALAVQRLGVFRDSHNIKDLLKALHDPEITVALNAAGALLKMGDRLLLQKVVSVLLQNERITEELFAEVLLKFERSLDLESLLSKEIDKYPLPSQFKITNLIDQITRTESRHKIENRLRNSKMAVTAILQDEDLAEELLDEIVSQYQQTKTLDIESILGKKEKQYPVPSRIKIIDFIGNIHRAEGAPILIDLLKSSTDNEEKISLIKALGNLEAEDSLPLLIDHLKNNHPVIRAQAAKALGAIKDDATIEPLSRLLEDEDWWCRHHAASSLYNMGDLGKNCMQNFLNKTEDTFAKDIITQFLSKSK